MKKKERLKFGNCSIDEFIGLRSINTCKNSFFISKPEENINSIEMTRESNVDNKIKFRLTYETISDVLVYDSSSARFRYGISILKVSNIPNFMDILKMALLWGYLKAFSLQYTIHSEGEMEVLVFLLFKNKSKYDLLENVNSLKQFITDKLPPEGNLEYEFLKSNQLEATFLTLETELSRNSLNGLDYFIEPKVESNDKSSMIIIDDDKNHLSVLDFYMINFSTIFKKEKLIQYLESNLSRIFKKGMVIFNFKMKELNENTRKIFCCSGYVASMFGYKLFEQQKKVEIISLEDKLDEFNNLKACCGLQRVSVEDKSYQKLLWRQSITGVYVPYRNIKEIFL